jgi:hypothetical protein
LGRHHLRWVTLVVVLAVQAADGAAAWPVMALAAGLGVWNLVLAWLALTNRRLSGHRWINVLVDALAALALFILSGGLQGSAARHWHFWRWHPRQSITNGAARCWWRC